jgi:hypothetical protein
MKSTDLEMCRFSGLRYRDGIIVRAGLDVVRFSFVSVSVGACALAAHHAPEQRLQLPNLHCGNLKK